MAAGEVDEDAKIIIRSNGTVTYVGKDIAYHLWKFGLLPGCDFGYAALLSEYPDHASMLDFGDGERQRRPSAALGKLRTRFIT